MLGAIVGEMLYRESAGERYNSSSQITLGVLGVADAMIRGRSNIRASIERFAGPSAARLSSPAAHVAPVAWLSPDLGACLRFARESSASRGATAQQIRDSTVIAGLLYQLLSATPLDQIARWAVRQSPSYPLGASALEALDADGSTESQTVAAAITVALQADSFEEALCVCCDRPGASATLAAITGALSEARYGIVPPEAAHRLAGKLAIGQMALIREAYERSGAGPCPLPGSSSRAA